MSDRARQFMPFSALKGFHELVREKERIIVAKKELSEDEKDRLSRKVLALKKGMMVSVSHFCRGEYIKTEGILTEVDFTFRRLTVVKTRIDFDDISEISCSDLLTKEK